MDNRLVMYVLTIVVGLYVSATGFNGIIPDHLAEWPVNLWCWGLFGYIYATTHRKERIEMITVVLFATPMELFFSEVWLIYEYQREFMPFFVPAGHYFLFDIGRRCLVYVHKISATTMLLPLIPFVVYGAYKGSDTSALLLLMFVWFFIMKGPQPELYAVMTWAALAMELIGTSLGNWTWSNEVPYTPLTAWNPPLLVGAFYCLGDLLVQLSVTKFEGQGTSEVII